MKPARWLQDHPALLETSYRMTAYMLRRAAPVLRWIGLQRLESLFVRGERMTKGPLFGCQMCGDCVLHSTGMTCPMVCPKNLRNGPCGGVRLDGKCEVKPEMDCVWVLAWERSAKMPTFGGEIHNLVAPLDRRLQGRSSWLPLVEERDDVRLPGWGAE